MNAPATSAPSSSSVNFGLRGRVCIVTGAAQGIGEACVRRFAREGAKVVIADIDDAKGQALAQELQALYVRCDVGDKPQVDTLVANYDWDAVSLVSASSWTDMKRFTNQDITFLAEDGVGVPLPWAA